MKILGKNLTEKSKKEALERFKHRYTGDNKPSWANEKMSNGKSYKVQFKSDLEWLENTFFYTNKDGSLSRLHKYCESTPTWPEGISDLT